MPNRSKPTIRPARISDIAALTRLEEKVFDADRISARSFRNLLERKTSETIVAEVDGEIAGYAIILFRRGTAMSRLYSLAVSPDHGGKGVGKVLLKAAEDATWQRGRMLIRLEVREDNERAIALYRKAGYRPIGRYLDYYADHATALRFEKTVRGNLPLSTATPYYEQTTDFTCGPCCLMMALGRFVPGYRLDPVNEIRLWREATTVFMMSGLGGCEPFGLAVAAHEAGLDAEIHVSQPGLLFLNSVRDPEKQKVMELAQKDFRARARKHGIPVHKKAFNLDNIRNALAKGHLAVILVSGYHMFGKKVPHWVLAQGDDGSHILIHDPWVEDEIGETLADAANLPVPYEQFERMSRFGRNGLRAAVILRQRKDNR